MFRTGQLSLGDTGLQKELFMVLQGRTGLGIKADHDFNKFTLAVKLPPQVPPVEIYPCGVTCELCEVKAT
jgi:hypothetical protein